mmetsp:Transcript_18310/g.36940  ORF Transcript_18310/g.36940 Transcript_18310/m.36940 type:complete len:392 (+) Transcript_18310:5307-6482(+)
MNTPTRSCAPTPKGSYPASSRASYDASSSTRWFGSVTLASPLDILNTPRSNPSTRSLAMAAARRTYAARRYRSRGTPAASSSAGVRSANASLGVSRTFQKPSGVTAPGQRPARPTMAMGVRRGSSTGRWSAEGEGVAQAVAPWRALLSLLVVFARWLRRRACCWRVRWSMTCGMVSPSLFASLIATSEWPPTSKKSSSFFRAAAASASSSRTSAHARATRLRPGSSGPKARRTTREAAAAGRDGAAATGAACMVAIVFGFVEEEAMEDDAPPPLVLLLLVVFGENSGGIPVSRNLRAAFLSSLPRAFLGSRRSTRKREGTAGLSRRVLRKDRRRATRALAAPLASSATVPSVFLLILFVSKTTKPTRVCVFWWNTARASEMPGALTRAVFT